MGKKRDEQRRKNRAFASSKSRRCIDMDSRIGNFRESSSKVQAIAEVSGLYIMKKVKTWIPHVDWKYPDPRIDLRKPKRPDKHPIPKLKVL